jgi:hypothetical protein
MHEVELTATVNTTASIETRVDRGVNEARMTGFTVILAAALSVGLAVGFASGPWLGLLAAALAAVATAFLLEAIYRVPAARRVVMGLMHRITGQ